VFLGVEIIAACEAFVCILDLEDSVEFECSNVVVQARIAQDIPGLSVVEKVVWGQVDFDNFAVGE
jgi:hypothetical protein